MLMRKGKGAAHVGPFEQSAADWVLQRVGTGAATSARCVRTRSRAAGVEVNALA